MIVDLEHRAAQNRLADRRVLVVEDEAFVADDTEMALEALGCMVIGPAPNETIALRLIDEHAIDCAVLDVNLGDHFVFGVAARLQQLGVPFIFTTGYEIASLPARFRARPHLSKPIDESLLARELVHLFASN